MSLRPVVAEEHFAHERLKSGVAGDDGDKYVGSRGAFRARAIEIWLSAFWDVRTLGSRGAFRARAIEIHKKVTLWKVVLP